jgi:sugar fermentation stimulation protein A
MQFTQPLTEGKILSRYKRFFADIELENGEVVTAHTPNTGSMKTCWEPGWKALISHHDDPKRKLKYTLEMTHNGQSWIGVHTGRPNYIVYEAIDQGLIPELLGYEKIRKEVTIGNSRIDLCLDRADEKCYVEVKNVTLKGEDHWQGCALFPDGVSDRGLKHLHELIDIKKSGQRAVMFFLVQREDVNEFQPAYEIDPAYADALIQAQDSGVEILIYQCQLNDKEIKVIKKLAWNHD